MTNSAQPILFLLRPDFLDSATGDGAFFCPYCLRIEGLLSIFPVLRHSLQICYVDFPKPRGALAQLAGAESQSCPQLVFPAGDDEVSGRWSVAGAADARRIENTADIEDYLILRYGLSGRHP